jgi:hypothetical protein
MTDTVASLTGAMLSALKDVAQRGAASRCGFDSSRSLQDDAELAQRIMRVITKVEAAAENEVKPLPNALRITASERISSYAQCGWAVEVQIRANDYDGYKSLPGAVTFMGVILGKTGWNSDNGRVCYQEGAPVAYAL